MKGWAAWVFLAWVLALPSVSASPKDVLYAEDADDLFWFVVIADTHVGQNLLGGTQDTDNLAWVVGEAFQTIRPRFVFICGDLVDATHGGLIPKQQSEAEWSEYRSVLDAHGMTPEVLVDLPGNHDQYCDKGLTHFRKFSMQGSVDDRTQHSVIHHTPGGFYHFLALATTANDGACWPADNAGLDAAELDFARSALADNAGARLHFAFGHHGVHWGDSNKVGEGGGSFRQLLQKYEVAAYFWGHTHDYFNEYHDGTLFFNVRSLGKNDDLNVALAAVDHNSLAVRAFTARKWPFVLVTAPADRSLGKGNPYAYTVPQTWTSAPVRALVFGVPAPQAVRFRVDDGAWQGMNEVAAGVYQGTMDATVLSQGEHRLRVRADPWNDADHEIRFLVGVTTCGNGVDDDGDGLTDFPDDHGCVNPADPDEADPPPLPEPEPVPETAETVTESGSDLGPDESVTVEDGSGITDAGAEGGVADWWPEEPVLPETGIEEAGTGYSPDAEHGTAASNDGAETTRDLDRPSDEVGRPVASVGGGCAPVPGRGRAGAVLGLLLTCGAAWILAGRRHVRGRSAR